MSTLERATHESTYLEVETSAMTCSNSRFSCPSRHDIGSCVDRRRRVTIEQRNQGQRQVDQHTRWYTNRYKLSLTESYWLIPRNKMERIARSPQLFKYKMAAHAKLKKMCWVLPNKPTISMKQLKSRKLTFISLPRQEDIPESRWHPRTSCTTESWKKNKVEKGG